MVSTHFRQIYGLDLDLYQGWYWRHLWWELLIWTSRIDQFRNVKSSVRLCWLYWEFQEKKRKKTKTCSAVIPPSDLYRTQGYQGLYRTRLSPRIVRPRSTKKPSLFSLLRYYQVWSSRPSRDAAYIHVGCRSQMVSFRTFRITPRWARLQNPIISY